MGKFSRASIPLSGDYAILQFQSRHQFGWTRILSLLHILRFISPFNCLSNISLTSIHVSALEKCL
jgi:hypothetical protein